MENKEFEKRISNLEAKLGQTKELMSVKDLSEYLGMKESYIYKLTSNRKIPHYIPLGKMIYFKKSEIDQLILDNRVMSQSEINTQDNKELLKRKDVS